MYEFFLIIGLVAVIATFTIGCLLIAEWHPKPKRTYVVVWRYDAMCPKTTVIVEAKSIAKAWAKVQKQHYIPIELISIEEIE